MEIFLADDPKDAMKIEKEMERAKQIIKETNEFLRTH